MSDQSHVHGGEESYSGVVPTKQPNKSEPSPAEVAEGRRLTKENTRQPNRTPSRESRPSGLERLRETATPNTPASEVGTVCVSSASTGLCGGQRATAVPTATATS